MKSTTHLNLPARLRTNGAIPVLRLYAFKALSPRCIRNLLNTSYICLFATACAICAVNFVIRNILAGGVCSIGIFILLQLFEQQWSLYIPPV